MTLSYGGINFAVRPNGGKLTIADKTADRPRRIEADIIIEGSTAYNAFLALHSIMLWDRALGFTTWTPRVKAGHGADTLILPKHMVGSDKTATYTNAYLVTITPETDAGHGGRHYVHAVWELA